MAIVCEDGLNGNWCKSLPRKEDGILVRHKGSLKFTDDFRADQDEMIVAVHLPAAAARNDFRLTIARKGSSQHVAEEAFTWSRDRETRQFVFSIPALVLAAGTGDFDLSLRSGDTLLLTRHFEIEPD